MRYFIYTQECEENNRKYLGIHIFQGQGRERVEQHYGWVPALLELQYIIHPEAPQNALDEKVMGLAKEASYNVRITKHDKVPECWSVYQVGAWNSSEDWIYVLATSAMEARGIAAQAEYEVMNVAMYCRETDDCYDSDKREITIDGKVFEVLDESRF